jgi:hypothetical protein
VISPSQWALYDRLRDRGFPRRAAAKEARISLAAVYRREQRLPACYDHMVIEVKKEGKVVGSLCLECCQSTKSAI